MPYSSVYRGVGLQTTEVNPPGIPEYDSVVIQYDFNEGQSTNAGSMNNIVFEKKTPAVIGSEEVTNHNFTGTYSSGVAPDWSVDVGVSASEDSNALGEQTQRVTNMNGVSQGLQGTSLTLTAGNIYVVGIEIVKNSGAGNLQIQLDGMNGMTGTYDIANADLNANYTAYKFYVVASANSSSVTITADNTALDVSIDKFSVRDVGGGNHMVMDHNLYDRSSRDSVSYDLNGVDQYFYIEDARQTNLDFGSDQFTIACVAQAGANANGTDLIAKNKNGDAAFSLRRESSFLRQFVNDTGGVGAFENYRSPNPSLPALPASNYEFLCSGYDTPNGLARMNINGSDQTLTYSVGPPLTVTSLHDTSYRASIGASFDGLNNATSFFDGRIGKMIIWKSAFLTETQMIYVFSILRQAYGI